MTRQPTHPLLFARKLVSIVRDGLDPADLSSPDDVAEALASLIANRDLELEIEHTEHFKTWLRSVRDAIEQGEDGA